MTNTTTALKYTKLSHYVYVIGIVCVIAGSLGHFFENGLFKYIFGVGAFLVLVSQAINSIVYTEDDFRKKRLMRMNLMLSLMLALATYSMFDNTTLWVAIVLIYALVTLIMSYRVK